MLSAPVSTTSPSSGADRTTAAPAAAPGSRPGLVYMAWAAFWFSIMTLLVKVTTGAGIPVFQVVLFRALVTLVMSVASLRVRRVSLWGRPGDRPLLIFRGLLGSAGLLVYFAVVDRLPIGEATVIHQTSPLWTVLLAAAFLGERLDRRVLLAIAISLCGVALIAQPPWWDGEFPADRAPWYWTWIAVGGAILAAGAYVVVRRLGSAGVDPLVIVFYFPVVTIPLVLPLVVAEWVDPTPWIWLALLGVGVATQLAQVALTKGLARERAGKATTMGYLQIAFAGAWGAIFLGEIPNLLAIAGIALVLAGLWVAAGRRRARRSGG